MLKSPEDKSKAEIIFIYNGEIIQMKSILSLRFKFTVHTRGASPDRTNRTIKVSLKFRKSQILFLASRQSHARKFTTTPHRIKHDSRTTSTGNMVLKWLPTAPRGAGKNCNAQ
jgi:hypothetical protein